LQRILTNEIIEDALKKFWFDVINNHTNNIKLNIIFKVYFPEHEKFKSISTMQKDITVDDFNKLLLIFKEMWSIQSEAYKESIVSKIVFGYRIISDSGDIKSKSKFNKHDFNKRSYSTLVDNIINNIDWKGYELPKTMDLNAWGKLKRISENRVTIQKANSEAIYDVLIKNNKHYISLIIGGVIILSILDTMDKCEGKLNCFKREINASIYQYKNGELIFKSIEKKCKFITQLPKSKNLKNKFLTLDLETYNDNGILFVYCISIYDGEFKKTFYLSDYDNSIIMLETAIRYLMQDKYNNQIVYIHNLSHFDSIFIINILAELSDHDLKPIRRDGKLINLPYQLGSNKVQFRDSYLILPSSLKKLALGFNVELKGIFPHYFVKPNNLNYIGEIPEYNYFFDKFNENSLLEYNNYKSLFNNKLWNLKSEAIKYCEQDVVTLYQVIDVFAIKIYKLFKVDIHNHPTLPSLAMAIFRSNFLKLNWKIPIITGDMYDFFKLGFTGGSVDVYKPYGVNIYRYDVNSLYPYVMHSLPVPIGNPSYFEGDILKLKKKPYGIFEVIVTSPSDMKVPILQNRFKLNDITSTIAPVGTWKGVYHSNEIFNAIKYGYKFEVIRGYTFNSEIIFKEYVNKLYNIKKNTNSGNPEYLIAKLLLNSLFGKFGMNPNFENHIVVDDAKAILYENNINIEISDVTLLDNNKLWLSYVKKNDKSIDFNYDNYNISIPIALTITANARVYMSQFKLNHNYELFYSDTDSLDINKKLPSKYVGSGLGKFKLEHIFKEAVFLAPKVYGGIAINNDNSTYELIKVKGYKNIISFDDLKSLLELNSKLVLHQEKWYKNYTSGNITIKNEIYTLSVTSNKRELIYNNSKILIDTKPFSVNEK